MHPYGTDVFKSDFFILLLTHSSESCSYLSIWLEVIFKDTGYMAYQVGFYLLYYICG